MADAYELVYLPGFVQDLQRLVAEAKRAPQGPEDRTLRVTMAALQDLRSGRERGTHRLGYMSSYPDLSDSETTYIWDRPEQQARPPPGVARAAARPTRRPFRVARS
jgi:hypothetical protein